MEANNAWGFWATLVQSIASLGWPCALFGAVWVLREDIRKLLPNLRVSHNGTEIAFTQARAKELVELVQKNEALQITAAPANLATMNLSTLSNMDLRLAVEDCAIKMREMEREFKNETNGGTFFFARNTDEFETYTQKLIDQSNDQRHRWQSQLMPTAVGLRDELLKRLKKEEQSSHSLARVAFNGMLAGVSPLNEAALYLERLARELPGAQGPMNTETSQP